MGPRLFGHIIINFNIYLHHIHVTMRNFTTLLAILFVFGTSAEAQRPYWELGFGGGVTSYWGDLNSESFSDNFMNMNPAGNMFLRYNYGKFSARAILTIGQLKGTDANSIDPGLSHPMYC